ncbi:hypothetical protein MYXO_03352 [Myxococcaceae bacterium]|nr:hypothetical protein MYXO_03352 [Myxococcaceae bacterium]
MSAASPTLVGVARERVYSPGKVDADRAILESAAEALAARGARVDVIEAEAIDTATANVDLVFTMAQGPRALAALRRIEAAGTSVVHPSEAILACHRVRMLARLERAGVSRPEARLVAPGQPQAEALAFVDSLGDAGAWVKRGDVHATEPGDVVRVRGAAEAVVALGALAGRGVCDAVIEAHVEGPTFKFYGVVGTGFFRAYQGEAQCPTKAAPEWVALAEQGARALGLGIYGGDLIVEASGRARLVDVNDWPSFSRCRRDAAEPIAEYLLARLREAPGA